MPSSCAGTKIEGVVDLRVYVGERPRRCCALEGNGTHLGGAQQLGAQRIGDDAARHGPGRQSGELGGGEAVVEPVDAEVGDRGHVCPHLHSMTKVIEEQQFRGQAEPAPLRRCRQRRPYALGALPEPGRPGQGLFDAIACQAPVSLVS